ncbi:hypothetical protein [Lysinibacillus fusiformis]|uniref:Uncharacterized protein n=1 Tax=Lysinibacillus fusiformis TaxID=28031 RepID=A0A1H9MLU2_9BACI|nr:hypothetical protein [Lysinibacillus fusiformis]SCY61376.1 hypothetical protein SAMN02787081_03297 [Lysinibacillus fusiformis]SEN98351.1 hypothetical protein SAMN02787103_03135 [Lysinibacillus fusiformis]SER24588.1 hypothetical protein SAMN02787113_03346 [Lysinibacillus fusiformis]
MVNNLACLKLSTKVFLVRLLSSGKCAILGEEFAIDNNYSNLIGLIKATY